MRPTYPATIPFRRDAGRPSAMPMAYQPHPDETRAAHMAVGGAVVTAIYRRWSPGQSRLCKLCPAGECRATGDACVLLVNRLIPAEDAPLFDSNGIARQAPADRPGRGAAR